MNKKEIVKKALERGVMLTPEMLNTEDVSKLDALLDQMGMTGGVIAGSENPPKARSQITVKMKKPKKAKTLTPNDVVQFYGQKFTFIRDILRKKVKAVSINKAKDAYSDVSVIGMVNEHTAKGFVLEDPTGEIEVVAGSRPHQDSVVGVTGPVREGRLFLQGIVFPDVPLDNMPDRIKGMKVVLSRGEISNGSDLVFTEEKTGNEKDIHIEASPCLVTVGRGEKESLMLAFRPDRPATVKDAVDWLRMRCLPHNREGVRSADNPYLIKKVPSILWVMGSEEAGKENYKGVTIVSCGRGALQIDFENMGVKFRGCEGSDREKAVNQEVQGRASP